MEHDLEVKRPVLFAQNTEESVAYVGDVTWCYLLSYEIQLNVIFNVNNPAGTIRWPYVDPMLGQRRNQHWINIGPTYCACWECHGQKINIFIHCCSSPKEVIQQNEMNLRPLLCSYLASTRHLYNIYTTLAERLRRWSNIVSM